MNGIACCQYSLPQCNVKKRRRKLGREYGAYKHYQKQMTKAINGHQHHRHSTTTREISLNLDTRSYRKNDNNNNGYQGFIETQMLTESTTAIKKTKQKELKQRKSSLHSNTEAHNNNIKNRKSSLHSNKKSHNKNGSRALIFTQKLTE